MRDVLKSFNGQKNLNVDHPYLKKDKRFVRNNKKNMLKMMFLTILNH